MNTSILSALLVGSLVAAGCSVNAAADDDGDGRTSTSTTASATTAAAKEHLGEKCFGGCGGEPGYSCAIVSDESCGGGYCLVDVKSTDSGRQYCTLDCSTTSCPDGYTCGEIDVVGIPGIQKGCVAAAPVCGDGTRQVGEICDAGEQSAEGTCSADCLGWNKTGKDQGGATQTSGEVKLEVDATLKFTAEQWNVQHEGAARLSETKLPVAGDADGCGAYRVIENTSELVRIELTHCNPATHTRGTLRVAIPRIAQKLDTSSDERFYPEAMLEDLQDERTLVYDTMTKLSATTAVQDGAIGGVYEIMISTYAWGGGGRATIDLAIALLPPAAP